MKVGTSTDSIDWSAQSYYGRTEKDRLTYRAVLFDLSYSLEKIPRDPYEFVAWLNERLEQVPAEYRAGAAMELYSSDCDECSSDRAKFYVYVDREETDAEYADRMEKLRIKNEKAAASRAETEKRKAVEKELRDRAEFERLKAKYGQ